MKIITFDLEIRRAILNGQAAEEFEEQNPGIEYVRTFQDFDKMGIACVCAFASYQQMPGIWDSHNLHDERDGLQAWFAEADLIVSYNGIGFDARVLAANGVSVPSVKHVDLLEEVRRACGKRFSLDAMAQKNLGTGKSGNGALAPIKWQQGKHAEVITYCLNDALITHNLFTLAQRQGYLLSPKGERISLKLGKGQGGLF